MGNNHGKIKTNDSKGKKKQITFFKNKLGSTSNGSFRTSILGYFHEKLISTLLAWVLEIWNEFMRTI
jgi:hypothetical protein